MTDSVPTPVPVRCARILLPFVALAFVIIGGAAWADSAKYLVTDPEDYQYFPPFQPNANRLLTDHLGAEYLCISQAIRNGRGFADPFHIESGPTAWMPPILPFVQAELLRLADDDIIIVKYVIVVLQTLTLLFTAWLVLAAVRRAVAPSRRSWLTVLLFTAFLMYDFFLAFQITHDSWLVLLGLDLLLIGYALLPDVPRWKSPILWGILGGSVAMAGPVLGLVWAVLTASQWTNRWRAWLIAIAAAGMVMLPWTVRNYRTFGRIVPVKSNAFYELYQSQCLTTDGLIGNDSGFKTHPWSHPGEERDRYADVGEMQFLDEKKAIVLATIAKAPENYMVRVWNRLASATMIYVTQDKSEHAKPPTWLARSTDVIHPLPFIAVMVLLIAPRPLHRYEQAALLCYVAWLLPYVLVSYYGRYGFPLIGVKVFLCVVAADRCIVWVRSFAPARLQRSSSTTSP